MANLFIGFPVPRARIAEMITGAAPPLEHIVNHLPPGSDPLVLPGDISTDQIIKWNGTKFIGVALPAAGAAFLFNGINIGGIFEDYAAYEFIGAEGTEYLVNKDGLTLHWQSGSEATISCIRDLFGDDPLPLWTKPQRLDLALKAWSAAPDYNTSYCIRGKRGDNLFGFLSSHGELLGVMGNQDEGYAQAGLLTSGQWNGHAKILSARLDPDNFNCKFYVNGVYIDEITSENNFPTGSGYLDQVFYMDLFADNENDYTTCNYWNFWQEL